MTEQEINKAFDDLADARQKYYTASVDAKNAEVKLDNMRYQKLLDGSIVGKNVEEREASAHTILAVAYQELDDAKKSEAAAKFYLSLAELEVERLKTVLQFMSLGGK